MTKAKLEYDPKQWEGSKSERGNVKIPTLEELVDACMEIILKNNSWENENRKHFWFFELAPVIYTDGDVTKIGKISEWRATRDKGAGDDIVERNNFFGKTPPEAVALLYLDIKENNQ